MWIDFDGKTIVVTGAANGIGAAIARSLVELNAHLVLCDVDETGVRRIGAELREAGASMEFHVLDVTDEAQWLHLARGLEQSQSVVGLVNNAGIGGAPDVETEVLSDWDRVVAVNQTGVFLGMKHVGPLIEQAGGGAIVNMASIFSTSGGFGNAIAYHGTKGAVVGLTRSAAVHWAQGGVRVNAVHPGFVATEMTLQHQDLVVDEAGHTIGELVRSGTPMRRLAEPQEIANVVVFLLSARASFMTGASTYVDGGWQAI